MAFSLAFAASFLALAFSFALAFASAFLAFCASILAAFAAAFSSAFLAFCTCASTLALPAFNAVSKSFSVHKPIATGFLALIMAESLWLPSFIASIVFLVVPISLHIWVSVISGQFFNIHAIAFGLSLLCDGDNTFLALALLILTSNSILLGISLASGSCSQRCISSHVN